MLCATLRANTQSILTVHVPTYELTLGYPCALLRRREGQWPHLGCVVIDHPVALGWQGGSGCLLHCDSGVDILILIGDGSQGVCGG